jgi:cystathionine beta-lyase/cystathionine gamma-synthase
MSAITSVAMELVRGIPIEARKGLRFIQGKTVYFNTNAVLSERMQEMGLDPAVKVDTTKVEEVKQALKENKGKIVAIFYETVTNPLLEFTNTREITRLARECGVPVIIDNTFLTPYLQQPLRLGADIVIHSMTKYISGYGDMLGGAVIGPTGFIDSLRGVQPDRGSVLQSTDAAKTLYERLGKLHERMELHLRNAKEIARYLTTVKQVEEIIYPALGKEDARHGSPGAVISYRLQGKDDEERRRYVRAMLRQVLAKPGPLTYKASLGEEGHLIEEQADGFGAGLMRLAVGRMPSAEEVIQYLKEVFRHLSA